MGRVHRNAIRLAALALVGAAQAQAQVSVSLGGGALIPVGAAEAQADPGFMGDASLWLALGETGLVLGAEGMYGPGNSIGAPDAVDVHSVMGWLRYEFGRSRSVGPYLFGGAGLMVCRSDGSGTPACPDDDVDPITRFGYGGGAGLNIPVGGRSSLLVEGRYMGTDASFRKGELDRIGVLGGVSIELGG